MMPAERKGTEPIKPYYPDNSIPYEEAVAKLREVMRAFFENAFRDWEKNN